MERKRNLYRKAGVREYWVVDTRDNRVTVYCFKGGATFTTYEAADTVPVDVLPGFSIALERVFAG